MITNNETIQKSNLQLLDELRLYKNWTETTYINTKNIINHYTRYHDQTMQELIIEAETDEEEIPLLKKRRIKKRLLSFQLYLQQEKHFTPSTIKQYLAVIQSIYNFYEIALPRLPVITVHNTENINDIPTNENIRKAINICNTKMKAAITTMASSGLARNELANLTIQDFIDATAEYHHETQIINIIRVLEKQQVIPTWTLTRIKTQVPYYTFCSNEATQYILQMLKERLMKKDIKPHNKLFDINAPSISMYFQRLNDRCGYGWKKHRRFLHAHSLRKYFSTTMYAAGMDFISIEFMLGHSIGRTQEAYLKANPEKQKNKYLRFVDSVTFLEKLQYVDISSKEKRELEELRRENMETRERLLQLEQYVDLMRNE